jgi:hypothetical protein
MIFMRRGDGGHRVKIRNPCGKKSVRKQSLYRPAPRTAVKSPGTAPFRKAAR